MSKTKMKKMLKPIHPGEVLLEEFLKPMEISQYRLAKDISVPPRRINEIVHEKRGSRQWATPIASWWPGSRALEGGTLSLGHPQERAQQAEDHPN